MDPVIAPRRKRRINRKNKLNLVFDEEARRDYLTGFHKRKLQRKLKAKEELAVQIKEEKKRLKEKAKAQYELMVKKYAPAQAVHNLIEKRFQLGNSSVSVEELDTDSLAETNCLIGRNKLKIEEDEDEENEEEEGGKSDKVDEVQGMEIKSVKDIKKAIKKSATKAVQKSKVFITKNKLASQKQRKQSREKKKERLKVMAKSKKNKHGKNKHFKKKHSK